MYFNKYLTVLLIIGFLFIASLDGRCQIQLDMDLQSTSLLSDQVVYRLKIIELSEDQVREISLVKWERRNYDLWSFAGAEISFDFLSQSITLEHKIERAEKTGIAMPELVVVPGQTARLKSLEEKIYLTEEMRGSSGFELALTPLRCDKVTKKVLSHISLNMPESGGNLETEIWLSEGEYYPLALVTRTGERSTGSSSMVNRTKLDRHFAFLIQANLTTNHGGEFFDIGLMGGLDEFFTPPPERTLESRLVLEFPVTEGFIPPDFGLSMWLTPNYLVEGGGVTGRNSIYQLGLARRLFDENLTVGTQLYYFPDKKPVIAFGVTDEVKLSSYLNISAGFYPFVFNIEKERQGNLWWVGGEINWKRTLVDAHFFKHESITQLNTGIGFEVWENLLLRASYRTDLDEENVFLLGFIWRFQR